MADTNIAEKIAQADIERQRINTNISAAYDACEEKGAVMPQTQNSANLADTIDSIPQGSTPTLIDKTITENGTYSAQEDNADGYSDVVVTVPQLYSESGQMYAENMVFSDNVTSISNLAYYRMTNIQSVYLPDSVVSIGDGCFRECTSLRSVRLSRTISKIPKTAFAGTAIDSILIPSVYSKIKVHKRAPKSA